MPNSFSKSIEGLLYITSGMDPMLRWDGIMPFAETAGVPQPITAPVISASGVGTIVGSYYSYVRFVDRLDNFSNLSPLSGTSAGGGGAVTALAVNGLQAGSSTGFISGATNTAPIQITSSGHGLNTGARIVIQNVEGVVSANGTWTITVIDANTFALTTSLAPPSDGGASPVVPLSASTGGSQGIIIVPFPVPAPPITGSSSGSNGSNGVNDGDYVGNTGSWFAGVSTIVYNDVATPTDPKIVRRQILRNTDGEGVTFFVDIDTTDLTSSQFTSTRTDTDLSTQQSVALSDQDGNDLAIFYYSIPSNDHTVLVEHRDRLLSAGVEFYTQGAVAIQNGSATVTGIGTEWTASVQDRQIAIDGASQLYTIIAINVATQVITLDSPYGSNSDSYSAYTIAPIAFRQFALDYSQAGLPDAWGLANSISVDPRNGGPMTTLLSLGTWVYLIQTNRIQRLTFQVDPNPVTGDGAIFPVSLSRGNVTNRTLIVVEDIAYMLDYNGIHAFSGNDDQQISQNVQDFFDPGTELPFLIHWQFSKFFHAIYDPASETIRWFVSLDGSRYPKHCLVYHVRTQKYWTEAFSRPIASSVLVTINGQPQVFLGTTAGQVLAMRTNELDGPIPSSGTTGGFVTSATLTSITDNTASYPIANVIGAPLSIVDGTGRRQDRRIVAVSGQQLFIDNPWLIMPDETSIYQIGAIGWIWKSGTFRWVPTEDSTVRELSVTTKTTPTPAYMDMEVYYNRSNTPINWPRDISYQAGEGTRTVAGQPEVSCDLANSNGYNKIKLDSPSQPEAQRPRFVDFSLQGYKGPDPIRIYEAALKGAQERGVT